MMFKNDKDKEMYCFLLVLQQFASGTISQDEFFEYVNAHTPPESKGKAAHGNRSREELTQQIINDIDTISKHIHETYFTGEGGENT